MNKWRVFSLLVGLVCLQTVQANVLPAENRIDRDSWQFDVFLDGNKIGFHEFQLERQGEQVTVQTEAQFDVKVLFVNLFSYRHQNTEFWQSGCLQNIEATTKANSDNFVVSGQVGENGFEFSDDSSRAPITGCVKSFAYWNPDFRDETRLLNSQTGEYELVSVERVGTETISLQGQEIPAVHYRLEAETAPISLWYSGDSDRWLALETVAKGGRVLRYEPTSEAFMNQALSAD